MLRRRLNNDQKAQVFLEYTMILGVIVMIIFAMNPMIKRGIQGMIKVVADQVGVQRNAEQTFDERGHLESQYISTRVDIDKITKDFVGNTSYIFNDVTMTESNTSVNLGFTEEN